MKIAFLDIDGVILPVGPLYQIEIRDLLRNPFGHLDEFVHLTPKDCVQRLQELATSTGAKFVLHSSWRRHFPDDYIQAYLDGIGLLPFFHGDWTCKCPTRPRTKCDDISEWLGEHPECTQFVVIDDDDIMDTLKGDHVRPKSKDGFSADNLQQAQKALTP